MINLIPNEKKKEKIRNFYFRFAVVSLSALGSALFIAAIAILPAFILSSVKKNSALKLQAETAQSGSMESQALLEIKDLTTELDLLDKSKKDKYLVSKEVISAIILKKMPDIKITEIAYENNLGEGKKVNLRGRAPSRERLLLFRRALEGDPAFSKVDLPISNFIKGSNIEFYLSLAPF